MRLAHTLFSAPIHFQEGYINILTIENKSLFSDLIFDVHKQTLGEEGCVVLSNNYTPVSIQKNLALITDPLFIDFSSKKIINKIYSELEQASISEDIFGETLKVKNILSDYILCLLDYFPLHLKYEANEGIVNILKQFNVSVNIDTTGIAENIVMYTDIIRELKIANAFVFVNALSYMEETEIIHMYKDILYKKLNIVFLENTFNEHDKNSEKHILIDKDLCEIKNDYCL